jgi:exopolyphosphatase/guanosine-5'-triphosphate,3'-diphosphate pyrophosphatase
MMRIAIIDLGTNTFNLLIADLFPSKSFHIVYNNKIPVKLGKDGINDHRILPDAMDRGIRALNEYKKVIDQHRVNKIFAFGTSAIREAKNGSEFLIRAKKTGIEIAVISGDVEAELIFKGVQLALKIGDKPALLMDIGGGSTEFVIANSNRIFWKQSFLLGVTRILEKFSLSDPITTLEIAQLDEYLRQQLKPLIAAAKEFPVSELIGSSGSFDSFAEIITYRFHTADVLKSRTEFVFDLKEVEIIFDELVRSDRIRRLNLKGLIEMRVDMIVISVLLARFVLRELGLSGMRLSTYALKEGVLSELLYM